MKLNNKGFAISSIMYIILIMAVILISVTLAILSSRKLILDKIRKETTDNIYGISYNSVINTLKHEAINYASSNNVEQENIKIGDFETSVSQELLEHHELLDKYLHSFKNNNSYDVYLGQTKKVTDISKPIDNMLGIVDYKIEGNSYQQTYTGKNLFDISKVVSSANVVNNGDGTLSVTPTAGSSGVSAASPGTLKDYAPSLEVGKTYYLNATTTANKNSIYFNVSNRVWVFGKTLTITEDDLNSSVYWYANGTDTSFTAVISNIQIVEGTTATAYEPYVGGAASPNPQYPQEIISVGERTKNLIDIGTVTFDQYKNIKLSDPLPAGTYTISSLITTTDTDATDNLVSFLNSNGDTINYIYGLYRNGRTSKSFNLTEPAYSISLYASNNWSLGANDTVTYKDIQIEKGNKATSFEGYYKIPVKISGKNLINIDDFEGEKTNGNVEVATELILEANKTYTLSTNIETSLDTFYVQIGSGDNYYRREIKTQVCNNSGKHIITFTPTNEVLETYNNLIIRFIRPTSANASSSYTYSIKNIQLEKGEEATNYEPYVEPITTNINLNEPLRKIGEYTDYIDFEKGETVREIAVVDMSKLSWFRRTGSVDYYLDYTLKFKEIYGNNEFAKVKPPLMCTHYDIATRYNMYNKKCTVPSISHFILNSRKTLALYSKGHEDATALINSLKGVMLHYTLEKPTEETIVVPNISTTKGASIIDIDTSILPSSVEFTVIEKIRKL